TSGERSTAAASVQIAVSPATRSAQNRNAANTVQGLGPNPPTRSTPSPIPAPIRARVISPGSSSFCRHSRAAIRDSPAVANRPPLLSVATGCSVASLERVGDRFVARHLLALGEQLFRGLIAERRM